MDQAERPYQDEEVAPGAAVRPGTGAADRTAREGACPPPVPVPTSLHPAKDARGNATFAPLTEIKRVWAAVSQTAGISVEVAKLTPAGKPVLDKDGKPVMVWQSTARMHDLRHMYASILPSSGLSLPVSGAAGPHAGGDHPPV